MKLYQIAAFYTPKDTKKSDDVAKIIVEPKTILAATDANAQTIAARMIPEDYVPKLEQVTVAVRPF